MTKPAQKRRTQVERREETRSRILDAAVSELLDNGYAGFRVEKVAAKAKVSRGAQTHHFPTKENLVLSALQMLYEVSTEASTHIINNLAPEDDILEALMKDSEKFFMGPNFFISMSLLNLGGYQPELRKKVQEMSRKYRLPIEEAWLEALIRSGLPKETARAVLNITQSIYRGMMIRQFLRSDPEYTQFTTGQWSEIAKMYIGQHVPKR